jgi:PncC family amidohydrolase
MLGALITSIPGSSEYFVGGILAYSDGIKKRIVGVKARTIRQYGAVSTQVAREMALAVKKRMASHIGIGITGIAGPSGGSKEKPIGLVFIGLAMKRRIVVRKFFFKGGREAIRRSACKQALMLLHEVLHEI